VPNGKRPLGTFKEKIGRSSKVVMWKLWTLGELAGISNE